MRDGMGFLDKLKQQDYVEVNTATEEPKQKMRVQVERLENYADTERIQSKVRGGCILIVKVRNLRERDAQEYRRAVERLKKTCLANNGDIAGLGEDWLIVAPASARVHREAVVE